MRPFSLLCGVAAGLLVACTDGDITGVSEPTDHASDASMLAASRLSVMTRNLYVGAPLEPILAETDHDAIPVRAAEAWAVLMATDFPTRAKAFAAEIDHVRPHLIGLQEVSLIRVQTPSDIVFGNLAPNAADTALDFLGILLGELDALGLDYRAVAINENIDVEIPRFDPTATPIPLTDTRLTDYDVVLARGDVAVTNPGSGTYQVALPAPAGFDVHRGWVGVDATVGDMVVRFVSTHLESDVEAIQLAQAQELIQLLAAETRPIVVVGDFNSGPGRNQVQSYESMQAAGYGDAWTARPGSREAGNTCCHAGDLSNAFPDMRERIDLVFTRNIERLSPASGKPVIMAWTVGDRAQDRKRFGIWPSDHAGVVARFVFANVGKD